MTIRKIGLATLTAVAALALVLGSAGESEAAKKKAKAKGASVSAACWLTTGPVCATKGKQKFTYASACYAANDGATNASKGACKVAKKGGGKKKAAAKPAKKKG